MYFLKSISLGFSVVLMVSSLSPAHAGLMCELISTQKCNFDEVCHSRLSPDACDCLWKHSDGLGSFSPDVQDDILILLGFSTPLLKSEVKEKYGQTEIRRFEEVLNPRGDQRSKRCMDDIPEAKRKPQVPGVQHSETAHLNENLPSVDSARSSFEERVRRWNGVVTNFSIVDRKAVTELGIEFFSWYFTATVNYPQGIVPKCVNPRFPDLVTCNAASLLAPGMSFRRAGDTVQVEGRAQFERTQSGWRPHSVIHRDIMPGGVSEPPPAGVASSEVPAPAAAPAPAESAPSTALTPEQAGSSATGQHGPPDRVATISEPPPEAGDQPGEKDVLKPGAGRIISSDVNVRTGPSLSATLAAVLKPNQFALIREKSQDRLWSRVSVNDQDLGWILDTALLKNSMTEEQAAAASEGDMFDNIEPPKD